MKYLVKEAHELAKFWHKGQKRWDGSDYYENHLWPVSQNARKYYETNEPKLTFDKQISDGLEIVGVLHDILEDTTIPPFLIKDDFGDRIYSAVFDITHQKDEDYVEYIERVSDNHLSTLVKIADLEHNMLTVTGNKYKLYKMARAYLKLKWEII